MQVCIEPTLSILLLLVVVVVLVLVLVLVLKTDFNRVTYFNMIKLFFCNFYTICAIFKRLHFKVV